VNRVPPGRLKEKPVAFNPLISIVIPVYNGANYLQEAVVSALAQTYKNLEVIVINDGSCDGGKTEKIARSYGSRLRYFRKENGGVASALNLGLEKMKGDYFSWLSHDDLYYPHKIQAQVEAMKKHSENTILYSQYETIDSHSRLIRKIKRRQIETDDFFRLLVTKSPVHGCTLLIPVTCFRESGTFDETLKTTQDYQLWFRMAKRYTFVHMPAILVKSRLHAEQGSLTMNQLHDRENNHLYSWVLDEFSPGFLQEKFKMESPWFYLDILLNYRQRRLWEASAYAFKKFISASPVQMEIEDITRWLRFLQKKEHYSALHLSAVCTMLGDTRKSNNFTDWRRYYEQGINILLQQSRKSAEEKYKIASDYKILGETDEAHVRFKHVLQHTSKRNIKAGCCFHLGELCFLRKDFIGARTWFEKCLGFLPGHKKALEYQRLLKSQKNQEKESDAYS
jgi:glycosyltransferase involved in cell wall biosynthesis